MTTTLKVLTLATLSMPHVWAAIATDIYPFKPYPREVIFDKVTRMSEDPNPLRNFFTIEDQHYSKGKTKIQPWSGSYWPLNQGLIANTYHDKKFIAFWEYLSWETNYDAYKTRKSKVLAIADRLSEKDIAKMAPSEKYDLLMGDKSFDLTNRIWDYAQKWGKGKKWSFLSSILLPQDYRIPKASSLMATWEGICHGWATAAGQYPRPEKTVRVTLQDGRSLPFYPDDIKALTSLMWANSIVQDNVIIEGFRCKEKNPKRDNYGRYVDKKEDGQDEDGSLELGQSDKTVLPSCADVHPAVLHMVLANVMGVQQRSFVMDKSAKAEVSNQPATSYEFSYFNPYTGASSKKNNYRQNVVTYGGNKQVDPFKDARHPDTKYIVGVETTIAYLDWIFPDDKRTNAASDDKIKKQRFMYDLELDDKGEIIGGQWRVTRELRDLDRTNSSGDNTTVTERADANLQTHQPDFIWVVPKNYMTYFRPLAGLPDWDLNHTPPVSWQAASKVAHSFVYQVTKEYGFNEKCKVVNTKNSSETKEVPCEFKYPRPQPLIQVVNKLIELSQK